MGKTDMCTSLFAELESIRQGLKMITECNLSRVMVETDSEIACRLLNSSVGSHPVKALIEHCKFLLDFTC